MKRIARNDIAVLCLWSKNVWASKNQYWCETPRAYELWEKFRGLNRRVKRFPKSTVFSITKHAETP